MARDQIKHLLLGLSTSALLLALGASNVMANPQDGSVVSGSATISGNGTKLDIRQSSDKAVIDWRNFNIAPNEHTQFHQPSASSFTLNRVTTGDASKIEGMLTANGRIGIINPNGVFFTQGAQVDVGGLIASTADIDNQAFMNGQLEFSKPGNAQGQIINDGSITAREAGLVGLVAPRVENNGVINARLGHVALASGDSFVLDLTGDGLLSVAITDEAAAAVQQNVSNHGTVTADGGRVTLSAATARTSVDTLITNKGTLQADSVGMKNGTIVLGGIPATSARTGTTTTTNRGTIRARGRQADETGGRVVVTGDNVGAMDNSVIDVSGDAGGGEAYLGGEYQGGSSLYSALRTHISQRASINADALTTGNGGRAIIWADESTMYQGLISARGGTQSGNGGFVEVSGHDYLDFAGTVDTTAAHGQVGTLLLDPTNVVISTGSNSNISGSNPFQPTLNDGPSILNTTTLQNALASSSVTVQTTTGGTQAGDITIANALSWNSIYTLTLNAHNDVIVNAPVSGSNLTFTVGRDLVLNSTIGSTTSGTLTIQPRDPASSIGIGAGQTGTLQLSATDLSNITPNSWTNQIYIGRSNMTGNINVGAMNWLLAAPTRLLTNTGIVSFNGAQNFNASQTVIDSNANPSINANLSGTGSLVFRANVNGANIGLAGEAGDINLTAAELNYIQPGFNYIQFGTSSGINSQINLGAYTWRSPMQLISNGSTINFNGATNMGSNYLIVNANADVAINAALTGTSTLTISANDSLPATTIGLGGAAGTIGLSTAELAFITNGWAGINIGNLLGTGAITANAATWNDPLTYRSHTGVITINGTQTMTTGNSLTFTTNADPVINAALTGSNSLVFQGANNATTIGVGGGAGTIGLTTTELGFLTNGWSTITLSSTTSTGAVTMNAASWQDQLTVVTNTGTITINGQQSMAANALSLVSNVDIAINAALTGTGDLGIRGFNTGTSMGLAGAAGTIALTAAELAFITNGWNSITFGRANNAGAISVGAMSWNDHVIFLSNTGDININGPQNMGANHLTFTTDGDVALGAAVTGSGALTFQGNNNATAIGIAGAAGALNLSTTDLAFITNGWSSINFGSIAGTGAITLNAASWNDPLFLNSNSGVITFNGAQTMSNNNLQITTDADVAINAALSGSANFRIYKTSFASMGIGTGAVGTINLSGTELDYLTDGWGLLEFYSGNADYRAYTWRDNTTFRTNAGIITINGEQTMGSNNLAIFSDVDPVINAALTGTGTLTLAGNQNHITMGLAGATGNFALSAAELDRITNGWSQLIFGTNTSTADMTVNAYSNWRDNVTFRSNTGVITIAGAQSVGANNLAFTTAANPAINAALTGTGTLVFGSNTAATTIGLAGAAGTLNLDSLELGRITNGWNSLVFGTTTSTGALTVDAASWNDAVTLQSGAGVITINGAQTHGANNLTILTDANPAINADVTGSGSLLIQGYLVGTSIGVGAAGTLNLTSAETARFMNWSDITVGRIDGTQPLNIGASNWNDPVTFLSAGNINLTGALTSFGTGTGTSFTLATAAGNFISTGGSINPGTGRYLIYSANPSSDTLTGLTPDFRRFSCTYGGSCPTLGTGNGVLYSYTPTLTALPSAVTIAYGDASPAGNYTAALSGYLGTDAAADVLTGTLIGTSTYVAGTSVPGIYNINHSSGTLASAMGYNVVSYGNNASAITVTKKDVTVDFASTFSRIYGDTNPVLSYSNFIFSPLVGSDTNSLFAGGISVNYGAVNNNTNVGSYGVTATVASTSNYNIISTPATTLTITPRALSVVTQSQSKAFGNPDPQFTGNHNLTAYDDALVSWVYAPLAYTGERGNYVIAATATDNANRLVNYSRTNNYGVMTVTSFLSDYKIVSLLNVMPEPVANYMQLQSQNTITSTAAASALYLSSKTTSASLSVIDGLLSISPILLEKLDISYLRGVSVNQESVTEN